MNLFAERGDKVIPWEIDQKIQRSGLSRAKKAIMEAIAAASVGYRVRYANVSLYEIRKYLGMEKSRFRRDIRDLVKLGFVTYYQEESKRLPGMKYVGEYYIKFPDERRGIYKVRGSYMTESGLMKRTEVKGAKKIGAMIDKELGKPKQRGKKEKGMNPSESYFLEQEIRAKVRREGVDPAHVIDTCVGVT